jgi:hypothetical protein
MYLKGRWTFERKNKFTLWTFERKKIQLTLKSMWTIERSSQLLPVFTCKVLHEFVLVNQLLLFSHDEHKGSGNK